MEGTGHKGIVLNGIGKDHQFSCPHFRSFRCFLDNPPHIPNSCHIDARLGGADIDRRTNLGGFSQGPRNGIDEDFIPFLVALLHQGRITTDKINPDFMSCLVQGFSNRNIVRRIRCRPNQRDGCHRNPLIDDWNTQFSCDFIPNSHQLASLGHNLIVDFFSHSVDVGINTIQERNTHSNGPNIEILLLNHFNGLSNLSNIHFS